MKPTLVNEVIANCLVGLKDVDMRNQKKIQKKFDQRSLHDRLSQATNLQERAVSQPLHFPNAWLTTRPISALGLHLEAEEFRSRIK